jgi:hypothetical protein
MSRLATLTMLIGSYMQKQFSGHDEKEKEGS